MPPYLYALVGAFVFAIAHGMHFTVAPLPGAHGHVTTLIERSNALPDATGKMTNWFHDDIRLAGIRY